MRWGVISRLMSHSWGSGHTLGRRMRGQEPLMTDEPLPRSFPKEEQEGAERSSYLAFYIGDDQGERTLPPEAQDDAAPGVGGPSAARP